MMEMDVPLGDVHGDADMMQSESEWYGDRMYEDGDGSQLVEIDMSNDVEDMIEYEMEDEESLAPATVASTSPTDPPPDHIMSAAPLSIRPQTPPPQVNAPEINFESPPQAPITEEPIANSLEIPTVVVAETSPDTSAPILPSTSVSPPSPALPTEAPPPESDGDLVRAAVDDNTDTSPPEATPGNESPPSSSQVVPAVVDEHSLDTETLQPLENEDATIEVLLPSILVNCPTSSLYSKFSSFYLFTAHATAFDENRPVIWQSETRLFYEPIASLFEAFRESKDDFGIPDHAELSICSEGLDLTITEDNTYASEVSLNDLHVLHLGCELEGPLLLRLEYLSQRFISRYQAIVAELNRVTSETRIEPANEHGVAESASAETLPEVDEREPKTDPLVSDPHMRADLSTAFDGKSAVSTANLLSSGLSSDRSPPGENTSVVASEQDNLVHVELTEVKHVSNKTEASDDATHNVEVSVPEAQEASEEAENEEDGSSLSIRAVEPMASPATKVLSTHRVTFEDEEQDSASEHSHAPSLGDNTQTTRFDSQAGDSQYLMFSTQDAEDVPYDPEAYEQDANDELDNYASYPVHSNGIADDAVPQDVGNDYTPVLPLDGENDVDSNEVYTEHTEDEPSGSNADDAWNAEADELIPYEEEEDYESLVATDAAQAADFLEETDYAQSQGDGFEIAYDEDDETAYDIDNLGATDTPRADSLQLRDAPDPPTKLHTQSPPLQLSRSESLSGSKRTFEDDETVEGEENQNMRLVESKRAKIQ